MPNDPIRDPIRLAALKATGLLDSLPESTFDRLTRLAARLLSCPVALVSLVDAERQFFKSSIGLPLPWSEARQTPLSHSFCRHVVDSGEPLVVEDAREDSLVSENLAIRELGVIAYLGVPLSMDDGSTLGSFCVIDGAPRRWSPDEILLLRDLGASVMSEISLRLEKLELQRAEVRLTIQNSAALILAESATLEAAIGRILRLVCEGFGLDVGEYWPLDRASETLQWSDCRWEAGPAMSAFAEASRRFHFARGEGLPGRIWASGEPAWIEQLDRDEHFCRTSLAAEAGLRSGFGLPVVGESGLLGVMTFLARETREADLAMLGSLTTLGRQVGQFAVRRQAEAEVVRLNAQLGAVLDAAIHVAIIATDLEGRIIAFNSGAERMLGYDRREMVDRRPIDLVLVPVEVDTLISGDHPPGRGFAGVVERVRERFRDTPDWALEREMTFLRQDGSSLAVSLVLTVVRDAQGEPSGLLGIAKDITESRLTERQMRKFLALVEHSGDLIAMVDLEGRLDYLNPAGRDLVGLEATAPAPSAMITDLLDGPTWDLARAEAAAGGAWVGEGLLRHLGGGGPIGVDINLFRVNDPETGGALCLATIMRDARQRHRAEAMLLDKEARLRCIIEASLDCLITMDHEGYIVEFNPAAERTFGYSRDQVLRQPLVELIIPPEFREAHVAGVRRYLETGQSRVIGHRLEIDAICADGERIIVELTISVVEIGGPPLFTASIRDIGERKQSERRLKESEQRFRGSFDNAPIGMALVATDGRWLRVNRALCEIVGHTELQLLGMDYQTITHPDDLEADLALVGQLLDNEISSYQIEKRYLHSAGHAVWVSLSVSIVREESGRPLYFISQMQDITRRKQIERDLERAKEQAVNASRSKSDFLANMSHEVRTPMTAILGYSDMLLDPRLSPTQRDQALQAIRSNGSHLLQIINDILDLSKIEAGRLDLELIPYSPWQVALEMVSALRIRADEKGTILDTRTVGRLPAYAIMDPTRVRQILVNLVSNAIKFSPPDGLVSIRLEAHPPEEGRAASLRLEVEDGGIGMTPAQLDQLFVPFQQADTSTTRKFGGTGLGLSITRRLAELMGGTISVHSEIGKGSCFSIEIPLRTDEEASSWLEVDELAIQIAPTQKVGGESRSRLLSGRILLAEDNPDNQRVLLYHLCRLGLEVEIVENGRAAVEKALRGSFDLVLMDMQMPELDGYGATSSLRKSGFRAPIIALTAHAMIEDREKCLRAGCTDFLTKPVDAAYLAEVLASHLGSARADPGSGEFSASADLVRSEYRHDPGMNGLVREFAQGLSGQVARLRSMLADGNLRGLESLAHQLRGVGGMYGYPLVTETASLIEDAIRERQDAGLLEELIGEFAVLVEKIRRAVDA